MLVIGLDDINLLDVGDTLQLAGALYVGDQRAIVALFPDEGVDRAAEWSQLVMSSPEWEKFLRQSDVLETEVLARAKDGTVAKAILRKSQRQIEQVVAWRCFRRDGYRCRYCAADDVPLTVDHLVRWEEGGPSTEANMLSACKKCNRVRGRISYHEWLRHPRYAVTSRLLAPEVRAANEALLATLSSIPRVLHVRTR